MDPKNVCSCPENAEYLMKHGIPTAIDKALVNVLATKPSQPLPFLASELMKVHTSSSTTEKTTGFNPETDKQFDYHYIVIGGGSGGMASAKEAAKLGAKVVLFDYVKPSTQGTKWGLGGTCVNVGCVPKKLMHYASLLGFAMHDAETYGWVVHEPKLKWDALVTLVQNQVRSLNFGYRNSLRSNKVEYINALARFASPNSVEYTEKDGTTKTITARYILIAVGGRPMIPAEIPGAREYAITSDDIFSLKREPGKTLVVGASYIALECAGFLLEFGYDVTVAVRSIFLRGFDQQCAEKIASVMNEMGVNFKRGILPSKIVKKNDTTLEVTFSDSTVEEYNTVLYATGRYADTDGLALDKAGLKTDSGKFIVKNEQTAVPSVFAVGDVIKGTPELTPVAIRAGELLARRLFKGATELMDYVSIPTTVFTPIEYGCCGLSEEAAEAKYGKENIETYLSEFTTLEFAAAHRQKPKKRRTNEYDEAYQPNCLSKLVCLKSENERVVGFHFVGPNAGEMTQGFALSILLGATKAHFDKVIGIHPTDAESFTSLATTRRSGESWVAAGGCGGGKCG